MKLEEIYAQLPKIECRRKCHAYCGVVPVTLLEFQKVTSFLGYTPNWKERKGGVCPMLRLRDGACKIYPVRPIICRLWGLVERMRCPHGCEPERWLSDEEATEIFRLVEEAEG